MTHCVWIKEKHVVRCSIHVPGLEIITEKKFTFVIIKIYYNNYYHYLLLLS